MAKTTNITLKDLIKEIDFRLNHLEDIEYDNRKLMVKLVKQGNQIVNFLKDLEISDTPPLEEEFFPSKERSSIIDSGRIQSIRELIDEFMNRHSELKELEEELAKHKDKITPGQIGEA